ncbi:Uma2 family endonuclease [Streptomyces sp. T-3]|nr:Uma2 family endonuclease [Streptomyces sp. T-3]
MSAARRASTRPCSYVPNDPETALKFAIRHIAVDRVQLVEGTIEPMRRSWADETLVDGIRNQIAPVVHRLGCISGAGDLDLPGSGNWYVPDLAVVREELTRDAGALLPEQTLLVVEVASESTAEADRTVKRRRYAEYRAPLYLLADRQQRACTLFSRPGDLGYTCTDGPLPFGTPISLPGPFTLELDTSEF